MPFAISIRSDLEDRVAGARYGLKQADQRQSLACSLRRIAREQLVNLCCASSELRLRLDRSTLRTIFRDILRFRAISLIVLPLTKCPREFDRSSPPSAFPTPRSPRDRRVPRKVTRGKPQPCSPKLQAPVYRDRWGDHYA